MNPRTSSQHITVRICHRVGICQATGKTLSRKAIPHGVFGRPHLAVACLALLAACRPAGTAQTAFGQARDRGTSDRSGVGAPAGALTVSPQSVSTPPEPRHLCRASVRDVNVAAPEGRGSGDQPPQDGQSNVSLPLDAPREPYLLRRGLYVFPAPYSPDYFSPLMRRFPDYSGPRGKYYTRESYYAPLYAGYAPDYQACCPAPRHPPTVAYYPPPAYGYGYGRYGSFHDAYEQGRYDADHEYAWYICAQRAGMLLNQYREMFEEGVICFRDGRYDWAVIKLLGAAEKNHANAASRLHAGHALFALGRYDEAAKLIARAFELSPSLWAKRYDLRDEYGDKTDFDKHLAALKTYVETHPRSAGAVTLLGYVTFYSAGPGAAYPHLKRAGQLDPKSYFIPRLLDLSYAASGMPTNHEVVEPSSPPGAPLTPPGAAPRGSPEAVRPRHGGGNSNAVPRGDSRKTKSAPADPGALAKDRPMAV